MAKKNYAFPTNEKVSLPVNVIQLVDDIVQSLGKLQEAFHAVLDKKYGPALAAILSVVQTLFVDQILPHIKALQTQGSEAPESGGDESGSEDGDSPPEQ